MIFVSIDDHEVANLRMVMDEIFGEENFIADFLRKTKSSGNNDNTGVNIQHENCLAFAKNKQSVFLKGEKKEFESYSNPDNDPKGDWSAGDPCANDDGRKTKNDFEIINPHTGKIDIPGV